MSGPIDGRRPDGPPDAAWRADESPDRAPWDALDGTGRDGWDGPAAAGRARRLFVLAAIPWLVVGLLGARTLAGPSRAAGDAATSASPTVPPATVPPTGAASDEEGDHDGHEDPTQGQVLPAAALRFGARVAPGPSDASATALVVARSWLGDVGPEPALEVGGAEGPRVYVEHLAVEAVDLPTADAAVVTVLAVVLDVEDDAYTEGRVVRLAVPVSLTADGAHPAGRPWHLPAPDLAVRPLPWTPVEDADDLAAAGAALEAAGYRDVSVEALARSTSWPLRVTATAVAPGDDTAREHTVWVRDHVGDLVVAGALPRQQEDLP